MDTHETQDRDQELRGLGKALALGIVLGSVLGVIAGIVSLYRPAETLIGSAILMPLLIACGFRKGVTANQRLVFFMAAMGAGMGVLPAIMRLR